MQLSNGKYYGSTYTGGINNHGTLFEYDVTTNIYLKKFDFDRTPSGINPSGALLQSSLMVADIRQQQLREVYTTRGVLFQFDPVTSIYTKSLILVLSAGNWWRTKRLFSTRILMGKFMNNHF